MISLVLLAFLSLPALVTAQTLPSCATTCVGNSISATGCADIDLTCICESSSWLNDLSCCVIPSCDTADQNATIAYAQSLCAPEGVTIPSTLTCTSSSSSSSSAASSTSSSSTASFLLSSTISTGSLSSSITSGLPSSSTLAMSVTPSSASQATPSGTAAAGNATLTQNHSSGLSHGAQIGIGVGVTVVVLVGLVALLLYLLVQRKKRELREAGAEEAQNDREEKVLAVHNEDQDIKAFQATSGTIVQPSDEIRKPELEADITRPTELNASPVYSDSPEVVHEIDASGAPWRAGGGYSDLPEYHAGGGGGGYGGEPLPGTSPTSADPVISEIEQEQLMLRQRRLRLMEIDRLDAEERELARKKEERLKELGGR